MATQTLDELIEIGPSAIGPQPRIAGRGIKVKYIVIWHNQQGMSAEEIAQMYDITPAQVYAALTYYYLHKEEMDARLQADAEFLAEMEQQSTSVIPPEVVAAWRAERDKNGR
jgi:uncharacterized protein (DUF433 family)